MLTNETRPYHITRRTQPVWSRSPPVIRRHRPGRIPVDVSALLHRTREAWAVWNHAVDEAAQLADGTDLGLSSRIRP
jgi:hypothetical protein